MTSRCSRNYEQPCSCNRPAIVTIAMCLTGSERVRSNFELQASPAGVTESVQESDVSFDYDSDTCRTCGLKLEEINTLLS